MLNCYSLFVAPPSDSPIQEQTIHCWGWARSGLISLSEGHPSQNHEPHLAMNCWCSSCLASGQGQKIHVCHLGLCSTPAISGVPSQGSQQSPDRKVKLDPAQQNAQSPSQWMGCVSTINLYGYNKSLPIPKWMIPATLPSWSPGRRWNCLALWRWKSPSSQARREIPPWETHLGTISQSKKISGCFFWLIEYKTTDSTFIVSYRVSNEKVELSTCEMARW